MDKKIRFRVALLALFVMLFFSHGASAQSTEYDKLITQAKEDLAANRLDHALAESKRAIGIDSARWDAHMIAAAALQSQKQYDEAVDEFTKALGSAPEAKKDAVKSLLEQCVKAKVAAEGKSAAPAAPAATTQQEIVLWKSIENSRNPEDFKAYLNAYPNGAFVPLAERSLTSTQPGVTSAPPSGATPLPGGTQQASKGSDLSYTKEKEKRGKNENTANAVDTATPSVAESGPSFEETRDWLISTMEGYATGHYSSDDVGPVYSGFHISNSCVLTFYLTQMNGKKAVQDYSDTVSIPLGAVTDIGNYVNYKIRFTTGDPSDPKGHTIYAIRNGARNTDTYELMFNTLYFAGFIELSKSGGQPLIPRLISAFHHMAEVCKGTYQIPVAPKAPS